MSQQLRLTYQKPLLSKYQILNSPNQLKSKVMILSPWQLISCMMSTSIKFPYLPTVSLTASSAIVMCCENTSIGHLNGISQRSSTLKPVHEQPKLTCPT